jgi:indole-3-glycerol phosphate synthase
MNVLRKIVEDKLPRLKEKKQNPEYARRIKELADERKETKNFLECCNLQKVRIIAEIKQASPSEGEIKKVNPVEVAKIYEQNGACAISVLTEENYFKGSLEFLKRVREAVNLPLLRKDFIVDELELWEAKAFGADMVLLIVKILDEVQLRDFIDTSIGLGLTPLVEIFEVWELERVLKYYDNLVGVNNRNLETLEVDLSVSERVIPIMKEAGVKCAVAESGITSAEDIKRLLKVGADAFLVGTSLMKSEDPGAKLRELISVKI